MSKIRVGISGAAGYTGGELIRILLHHPHCEIAFAHSRSNEGRKVYEVHEDLYGDTDIAFSETITHDIDVLFLCNGHGDSKKFLESYDLPSSIRIIDLSQDHRVHNSSGTRSFTYGLCEMNRHEIQTATNIANPGCFATAIHLALLPLAVKGHLTSDIHINAITGTTGAGQAPSQTTHYSWRNNNHSTYKPFSHQHLDELKATLNKLTGNSLPDIHFLPNRGSFARGIHAAIYLESELGLQKAETLFHEFYKDHPFTHVTTAMPHVKQVVNTNKCYLKVEKHQGKLMVTSVIDNLLKGASGQAVQNLNIMFGIDETAGLKLKASVF